MAEITEEFEAKVRAESADRAQLEFADLQAELSGLENGRMKRFLDEDTRDIRQSGKREKADQKHLTRLQVMLASNAAYAALYEETFDAMQDAEKAVENALALAIIAKGKTETLLNETLDRAQRLPDGTRIFRDANERVWTEHGKKIDPVLADAIQWRGNEPSYEDFQEAKSAAASAIRDVSDIQEYQVDVLGHARNRMADEDNPPTTEELEQIQIDINEKMPEPVYQQMSDAIPSRTAQAELPNNLDVPKL